MTGEASSPVDRRYLVDRLQRLARIPTDVPLGFETLMEPDDPKLVHYVQVCIRPELVDLGCYDLLDAPRNNLVVRLGTGDSGRSLLIQNYTPAQHHNLMSEPFSGKVASAWEHGCSEPCVFGQGVSQNKGHQAVMLAVLQRLTARAEPLRGRLYWAINNEGRSSHACSESILATVPERPEFGILQTGTGLALSLGNRGRVDVNVHVRGEAAHSSTTDHRLSAIDGAHAVIERLKNLTWPDRHPILGARHARVYKIRYAPLAPHTFPSDAFISVDRRLLPGDDPDRAAGEIREAIGDLSPWQVRVERGVHMWPALVDAQLPWVGALEAAHRDAIGQAPESMYGQGTYDAGGPCALGVPTVMYGARGGMGLTGPDFVPIVQVETEANVLLSLIERELG